MNTSLKNHAAAILASLVLCAAAAGAMAANLDSVTDADLQSRVQLALHDDPYFYDSHVVVSVDHGVVHLNGLVFSEWDLRTALRIAGKAAGNRRVIDNLTLIEGGRR